MNPNAIQSKIVEVTVFQDRAQITRTATTQLTTGEHTLIFTDLPDAIDADSLRVSGSGPARLNDVKLAQHHSSVTTDEGRRVLENERDALQEPLAEIDDQQQRIEKERKFVDRIVATLTHASDEPNSYRLEPERWINMVDFYRSRLAALDQEDRDAKRKKQKIALEIDRLNREINAIGYGESKSSYEVAVSLEVSNNAEISLELKYIVHGPSWYPMYDLRVDSDKKSMSISYQAMVQQATSEDWPDVILKLSTAQAHISGNQPQLSPWRVNEYIPAPEMERERGSGYDEFRKKAKMSAAPSEEISAEGQMFAASAPAPLADATREIMRVPSAHVESLATSVVFSIPGQKSIKSDNQSYRVSVAMEEFSVHFRYSTVPKLTPYAYLKAKVINTSSYPLLRGETQVFLDNQFVAKSSIPLVACSEEFWIYLGIDAAMKVEHQFLRRHQTQTGLLNKATKFIYEYKITLTNNKKSTEEIVVWDQLPISSHQKILVELVDPVFRGDNNELNKNDLNYLEWFFRLAPGEKKELPLTFSIEYPVGMVVTGL